MPACPEREKMLPWSGQSARRFFEEEFFEEGVAEWGKAEFCCGLLASITSTMKKIGAVQGAPESHFERRYLFLTTDTGDSL
jgi:hypothetical protein